MINGSIKELTNKEIAALYNFISSICVEEDMNKRGLLFVYEGSKGRAYDMNHDNKLLSFQKIKIENITGILFDFFETKDIFINAPSIDEGSDITYFADKYLQEIASLKIISDLQYSIFKEIFNICKVFINQKTLAVGLLSGDKTHKGVRRRVFPNSKELEKLLEAERKIGYVSNQVGDKDRGYAYGHLLRKSADKRLPLWAINCYKNWKKVNVIAATRGQGKTFFACEHIAKEMLREDGGYGKKKNRSITFYVPNKKDIGQNAIKYLRELTDDITISKTDEKGKLKRMPAFTFNEDGGTCFVTGSTLKIVSLHNFAGGGGEGMDGDVVVIDEAARIPGEFFTSLFSRASFEADSILMISTINKEMDRDHPFYTYLLKGEAGDPNVNSMRLTIYDSATARLRFSTDAEFILWAKERKEEEAKISKKNFYARIYSIFFDDDGIFDVDKNVVSFRKEGRTTDFRVIGYDVASTSDNSIFLSINLNTLQVEYCKALFNSRFTNQLSFAKSLKDDFRYGFIIGDGTGGTGDAIIQIDEEKIIDHWLKTYGANTVTSYNDKKMSWQASKTYVIETAIEFLNEVKLEIPSDLNELIEEMKNFQKTKTPSGNFQYSGKRKNGRDSKDDRVLSLCYAIFGITTVLGLQNSNDIKTFLAGDLSMHEIKTIVQASHTYNYSYVSNFNNSLY